MDGRAHDVRGEGPRPRAGRVRRHEHPGRTVRINPSFTTAEHAEVVTAARRAGLTPTGFCATAALAVARGEQSPTPPASAEREALARVQVELFDLRTAINRVGTNLNQAVTVLNSTGSAPVWLSPVAAMCARTLARVDEVISTVHRQVRR